VSIIIVIMMFIDRSKEMDALQKRYISDDFEFMVIYGRRRIGKTELIKQFSKDKRHIYFLSPQDTEDMQISKFLKTISRFFDEPKPDIKDWSDAIDYLKTKLEKEKMVFSIDEFPYLVQTNRSILSYLQGMIDGIRSDSMLILSGSSISIMESEVMGHKSPLYGRRSGQIDLQPFDFTTSLEIIDYPLEESVRSFSITGGTPMYLLQFDYDLSLEENLKEKILDKTSFMYEEPVFLLRTELRNPNRYMSILEAIAAGNTVPNRISDATGIDPGPLSKYLKTLRRLRLIKREIPVTAEQKRSKRSIYRIDDDYFRFWFRFIEPKRSWIEETPEKVLAEDIMSSLDEFTSKTFEDISMEYVRKEYDLPNVGRWWTRGTRSSVRRNSGNSCRYKEDEIDIVGLDEKRCKILFGECKWSNSKVDTSLLDHLKRKSKKVRWMNKDREEEYVLFSRSGFTEDLVERCSGSDRIHLYSLEDMMKVFGSQPYDRKKSA